MILNIIGLLLILFIPGVIWDYALFKNQDLIERIVVGFGLSIGFDIVLAFVLGGNTFLRNLTGGYTYFNVIGALIVISACGLLIKVFKK